MHERMRRHKGLDFGRFTTSAAEPPKLFPKHSFSDREFKI